MRALGYEEATWTKAVEPLDPWYHPYKTARVSVGNTFIGYAGTANPLFLNKVLPGNAFLVSLNVDVLLSLPKQEFSFKPMSKYPDTWFDISMLIPVELTVAQLKTLISNSDTRIFNITLIDLFAKKEWQDQRSLTLRIFANDQQQTLSKEAIDALHANIQKLLSAQGVVIR